MKILVLSPYLPDAPDRGGAIRSRVLLAAATRCGDVTLAAPGIGADAAARAEQLSRTMNVAVHGLRAVPDPRPSVLGKLWCWLRGRSEVFDRRWIRGPTRDALRQLIEARKPDLVIVDGSHALSVLPACEPPVLLHLHNVESALLGRRDAVPRGPAERIVRGVESAVMARAEAAALRGARAAVTVSAIDRERALRLCPSAEVHVVENAVPVPDAVLPPPEDAAAPLLLYVGDYGYPPNAEAARALVENHLPELRRAFPGLRVRLVGADPDGVATGLVRDGVEATGRADDLEPHYRAATAAYLPIHSGGGTRIKVLEAFAMGRPVIATAVAVEGLAVTPEEHYFAMETPAGGVEALRRVLDGAAPMVVAARALVEERWGESAAIDAFEAVLRTVAAPGNES